MKTRLGTIRRVIREEYLRGVPDWALRQVAKNAVDELREHIKRYVSSNKKSQADVQHAFKEADEALNELEDEITDLIEEKLFQFVRRV